MKLNVRGVILAGGTGSRLSPLTKVTNKHLLPVGRKPMIYYPVEKLCGAGVRDILVVTGLEHMGAVVNLLGSGRDFGCKFTYKVQDESGGIAQALGLAEEFAAGESVVVILGDNIFEDPITPYLKNYIDNGADGAQVLLKEVEDPSRFGVAEICGENIVSIEEKPAKPKSRLAVTGIYFYDSEVYSCIRKLKPSARNELEITDVNNFYISKNKLRWCLLKGWWSDAGTFESLSRVQKLVEEAVPKC